MTAENKILLMKMPTLDDTVHLSNIDFTEMHWGFSNEPLLLRNGDALHIEKTEEGVMLYRADVEL